MQNITHYFAVRLLGLLLLLLTSLVSSAQPPAWQTITVASGNVASCYLRVTATTTDISGNIYLTGVFTDRVVFGNITLTGSDSFVAKWSPVNNSFMWAITATTGGTPTGIAVNGTSVYITGSFYSSTIGIGSTTLINAGNSDIFIAKITDVGSSASFTWAQQIGGTMAEEPTAVAVSGTSVYVAGSFSSATTSFGNTSLTNPVGTDAFVAKLTDLGSTSTFIWAQSISGAGTDQTTALVANGTSVYAAGTFSGATVTLGTTTLASAGGRMFLTKLADVGSNASYAWVQQGGSDLMNQPVAMAINGNNIYVTNTFRGTAQFNNIRLSSSSNTYDHMYLAKLTDTGASANYVWARQAGGNSNDAYYRTTAIAVRGANVYVAGVFSGTTSFDNINLIGTSGTGFSNLFVTKAVDTGSNANFAWAQQAVSGSYAYVHALAASATEVYVAGAIGLPASFGNQTFSNPVTPFLPLGFLASLTEGTLATRTTTQLEGLVFYPNPAHTSITVQTPVVPGATQAFFIVTDVLGRVVRTKGAALPIGGLLQELDLTGLAPGLYSLHVQAGAAMTTRRLVLE